MKLIRRETGLMELQCPHGVGHPSRKLTEATGRRFRDEDAVHGCDGCCASDYFEQCEESMAGAARRKGKR